MLSELREHVVQSNLLASMENRKRKRRKGTVCQTLMKKI